MICDWLPLARVLLVFEILSGKKLKSRRLVYEQSVSGILHCSVVASLPDYKTARPWVHSSCTLDPQPCLAQGFETVGVEGHVRRHLLLVPQLVRFGQRVELWRTILGFRV